VTGLTIRPAGPADLAALLDLYEHLNGTDRVLSAETSGRVWSEVLGHPGLTVLVGTVPSGELAASCTLVVVPNLTRAGRSYALIENVVTHATHRRRGHGRAVLDAAVAAAWEAGCYKVMLLTGSTDPGTHRFYAEAGFQQSKTGYQIRQPEFQAS